MNRERKKDRYGVAAYVFEVLRLGTEAEKHAKTSIAFLNPL